MAHTAQHSSFVAPVLHILAAPFVAIGNAMIAVAEANSHVRRAEALHAMSDEELADIGIRREDIARHVFSSCGAI